MSTQCIYIYVNCQCFFFVVIKMQMKRWYMIHQFELRLNATNKRERKNGAHTWNGIEFAMKMNLKGNLWLFGSWFCTRNFNQNNYKLSMILKKATKVFTAFSPVSFLFCFVLFCYDLSILFLTLLLFHISLLLNSATQ